MLPYGGVQVNSYSSFCCFWGCVRILCLSVCAVDMSSVQSAIVSVFGVCVGGKELGRRGLFLLDLNGPRVLRTRGGAGCTFGALAILVDAPGRKPSRV
jgi:hypothetical protein